MSCRRKLSQTSVKTHYQSFKISFRSESMRATSLGLVFGMVLLMAWTSESSEASRQNPYANAVPERCCFNFIGFPIPGRHIVSALKTGTHCPVEGIVVTTKKGLEFCVKPDELWIKKAMGKQS
ncbi:hypothetical protein Q8A67_025166 [Cirrhinus molitorella]|uniref:Chemokine interleukin-8-like domain-containing protein n=1 Tax=Cirrhinus molitorella TaxID=172907 RepID=A0AA88P027_9TELE|nr:hypothetical protein Q8A67_025166 [Cirrhinus molitorella]